MTNILKDIWDDYRRGACWLPRDVFAQFGFDLSNLADGPRHQSFQDALGKLIAIAHAHLRDALTYTLLIPTSERGIRRFCFWAIGMALLTLRKINRRRDFTSGQQVKISRGSVKAIIVATELVRYGRILPRFVFAIVARGLPPPLAPSPANTQAIHSSRTLETPSSRRKRAQPNRAHIH